MKTPTLGTALAAYRSRRLGSYPRAAFSVRAMIQDVAGSHQKRPGEMDRQDIAWIASAANDQCSILAS
jgi:hypothetical protein